MSCDPLYDMLEWAMSTRFADLAIKDVFYIEDSSDIFIRIEDLMDEPHGETRNVFNVSQKELQTIDENPIVIPITFKKGECNEPPGVLWDRH